jgi:hypothetical protein
MAFLMAPHMHVQAILAETTAAAAALFHCRRPRCCSPDS